VFIEQCESCSLLHFWIEWQHVGCHISSWCCGAMNIICDLVLFFDLPLKMVFSKMYLGLRKMCPICDPFHCLTTCNNYRLLARSNTFSLDMCFVSKILRSLLNVDISKASILWGSTWVTSFLLRITVLVICSIWSRNLRFRSTCYRTWFFFAFVYTFMNYL